MATPNQKLLNARQAILNQGGKLKSGTQTKEEKSNVAPSTPSFLQTSLTQKAKDTVQTNQQASGVSFDKAKPQTPVLDPNKAYVYEGAFTKNSDYRNFMEQDNTIKYKTIYGSNGIYTTVYDKDTGKMFDINSAKGKEVLSAYGVNAQDIEGKTNLYAKNTMVDAETGMAGSQHPMYQVDVEEYLKGGAESGLQVVTAPQQTEKSKEKERLAELNMYGTEADKAKEKAKKVAVAEARIGTTGNAGELAKPEVVDTRFGEVWQSPQEFAVGEDRTKTVIPLSTIWDNAGNFFNKTNYLQNLWDGMQNRANESNAKLDNQTPAVEQPAQVQAQPAQAGGGVSSSVRPTAPALPSPEELFEADKANAVVRYGGIENLPEYTYTPPKELDVNTKLKELESMSFSDLRTYLKDTLSTNNLSEIPSSQINTILMANMGLDVAENNYKALQTSYSNAEAKAKEAYLSASLNVANVEKELDSIIKGEATTASSLEGLGTLIAKQNMDMGLDSLEATEERLNAEYRYTFNDMLEQNARLEGYMKAKLNFQGASTSSEALSMLAHTIDKSQQRLMLYNTQYTSEMVGLENTKRGIMNDFYNSVNAELINLKNKKSQALGDYNDKLQAIADDKVMSEMQAETEKFNLISNLNAQIFQMQDAFEEKQRGLANESYARAMGEFQIVRSIEQEQMAIFERNLGLILEAYSGKSFDELPADTQKDVLTATTALGLPVEYARQALASIKAQIMASQARRSSSSSSQDSGIDPDDFADYELALEALQTIPEEDRTSTAEDLGRIGLTAGQMTNYQKVKNLLTLNNQQK